MQQGGQGSEGRHPSSPRGANGGNLPKFSLLGQQLTSYAHQNPAASCNMGFTLGVHPQVQNHQSHSQAFAQAQGLNNSGGGGGSERSYSNFLQNMNNPAPVAGPSFSQNNNQNNGHFLNQLSSTGQDYFNKNSSNMNNMQGCSPEAIMSALQIIQQKIGQLQAIVPLLASGPPQAGANQAQQQQQVAAASTINMISQLAAVASSMFPGAPQGSQQGPALSNQQQQQQPMGSSNFTGSPTSQLSEIIQNMSESLAPQAYNFFQQQGGSSAMGGPQQQGLASITSPSTGNNFHGMQAGGGGNSLASPLEANLGAGVVGGLSGVYGSDGGGAAAAATANPGQQNFVNREFGNVLSNQMGNGGARNNALGPAGGGGRESTVMSRPPLTHQSVTGSSPSQLEDEASRRRSRDEDDDGEGEKLDPSEYELIEMDAVEILAEHTHFCEICGKGFKRDANLRMHMRGHGDEYKTPAALARPDKAAHDQAAVKERRYSCPYAGCKRNKKHRKFAPLKTMLCVKNHYRRSHCPKMLSCAKCKSKKFSVVADLKTHEKHCGCDKWQCSCGTTFSRKDKLLGHIALFAGHTPAVPLGDSDNQRDLDALDLSASSQQNLVQHQQQQQSVNNSSQYNISGNGMISGLSSGMGGGGNGSGMGHIMQSNVGSETPSSSSYSQAGQGLLPESSMLSGLYTSNF